VATIYLNAFNECTHIQVIDFSEVNLLPSTLQNTFNVCQQLVKILGEFDLTNVTNTNGAFVYCSSLEELRIKANTLSISTAFAQSPNLSAETLQSIIDGLATVDTAQTLTLNKNIILTDEQKATINAKGWTLAQ
jgi:hypothetical protein